MADNLLNEPIIDLDQILQLIPQKPPFVMVDSLLEYSENTGTTGFTIPADNILVKDAIFSEPGLIEHMAQSMSLWRGYQGYISGLDKPKTGFIGAIKAVEIIKLPKATSRVVTYVKILQEFMNVTSVGARTFDEGGNLLATSEMKTVTVD
jgi:predicted hotdog family 3-hydroxylacyl-ACP dehydratase